MDGWKNSETNKKLLVFSLTNFRILLLYLTSVDISLDEETGEKLCGLTNDVIKFAKDEYDSTVLIITTDNDSKIKCGARMAENIFNEPLFQCTCNSHSANLLIKKIIELYYQGFKTDLDDVLRAYSTPKIHALMTRLHGNKLKTYPDTRWCYIRDSCESVISNLGIMRCITQLDDHGIQENICELVTSIDLINSRRYTSF